MAAMFRDCTSLTHLDLSGFTNEKVEDMSFLFQGCEKLKSITFGNFGTSNVKNMLEMFSNCRSLESADLKSFATTNVTNMSGMFMGCSALKSIDVSSFNTSNVTSMADMFYGCKSLRSIDISNFDMNKLEKIPRTDPTGHGTDNMFLGCDNLRILNVGNNNLADHTFNPTLSDVSPCLLITGNDFDLSVLGPKDVYGTYSWQGGHVALSSDIYSSVLRHNEDGYTLTLKKVDLLNDEIAANEELRNITFFDGNWRSESSGVDTICIDETFKDCHPTDFHIFRNMKDLKHNVGMKNLNTSEMTDMSSMFEGCTSLEDVDLSGFRTSKVTNIVKLFKDCSSLKSINLKSFSGAVVSSLSEMFKNCRSLEVIDLSELDTKAVTDMSSMLAGCRSLKSFDLGSLDTRNVTRMGSIFSGCESLDYIDFDGCNTSKVTDMSRMFADCPSLTNIDITKLDTRNVIKMSGAFMHTGLSSFDLGVLNTNKVTDMSDLFAYCDKLTYVETEGADLSSVTDMSNMFAGSSINTISFKDVNTNKVVKMNGTFADCHNFISFSCDIKTDNVKDMRNLFANCDRLGYVDLSNWNMENVDSIEGMFYGCYLYELTLGDNDFKNVSRDQNIVNIDIRSYTGYDPHLVISENFDRTVLGYNNGTDDNPRYYWRGGYFTISEVPSGIKSINMNNRPAELYDLSGKRAVEPNKGIVISAGRKYIVK